MPVPLIAAGFFARNVVRIGLGLLGLMAVAFFCWRAVDAVRDWQVETYNKGFSSGSDMQEARWQRISAANARLQRDQVLRDAVLSNTAVKVYLDDLSARKPLVVKVEKEIVRYAQSPVGVAQCLDDAGVRLLLQGREAAGLVGQTRAPAGSPGPVPGAVRPEPAPVAIQH